MTLIEYFNKRIEEEVIRSKKINDQKIMEYIHNNNSKLSLRKKQYGYTEIVKFKNNMENYFEENPTLTVNEGVLSFSNLSLSQIRFIITSINPNIEELEIPFSMLKNIKLNNYSNLTKLSLNSFDDDNLKFEQLMSILNNSNIKEIESEKRFTDDTLKQISFIDCGDNLIGIINGKKIKNNTKNYFFKDTEATLYSKDFNEDIDILFELLSEVDKQKLRVIKFFDNYENINKTSMMNKYYKYSIEYVKINDPKEDCILNVNNLNDVKELISFIEKSKENGFEINKIILNLENKDYENIDMLYSVSKKYNIVIKYGSYSEINVIDFISMRETLNYYKELILQQDLSPLEKVTYGYDIIKSFVYKETNNNDKSEARNIHSIVKTGNIVCVGYANFYAQLMKEVGIEGCAFSTTVPENGKLFGHERCTLNVDDDKYNIHGSFAFDPTWDSAKGIALVRNSKGEERLISTYKSSMKDDEKIIKQYDDISRYKYFLIGKNIYQKVFEGEKMPNYTFATDYSKTATNEDKIQEKFNLNNVSLSLEQFEKLIARVRLCEGYSLKNIDETVNDVLEVNGLKERNIEQDYRYKM